MDQKSIDRHSQRLWDDIRRATNCQACEHAKAMVKAGLTDIGIPIFNIDGHDQACPARRVFKDIVVVKINNCPECGKPLLD